MFFIQECQKVAIIGLGGVGKTQIALNFAYWVKENKPNFSIFWVPAISHASFEQTYTEMARKPCIRRENDDNLMQSVRQYLSSEAAGRWLLIVDNADDIDMLRGTSGTRVGILDYIPDSESGLILFTTLHRDVAVDFQVSGMVELNEMSPQEAESLLETSLTYLPLAITQAAAYLNRNQISIAEYLGLLRGTEQDVIHLLNRQFSDNTRYKGSQNAVATTWLVSFEQIIKCDSAAADLLSFISCIEPKAIPQSLLPRSDSNEEMMNAIGTLRGFSFLVKRGGDETFDMHSLVHLATRIWIEQERLATKTMEKAICHLNVVFPSDEHENRSLWRDCLPHAFAVLYNNTNVDIKEKYELALRIEQCLLVDGRITEAVGCLEVCRSWWKSQLLEEHPDRLASEHELARAYLYNRQTKQAITLLEDVVAIEKKTLAKEHPDRLVSQQVLALAYLDNKQAKQAIALLEDLVAIREKTLAKKHPDRLSSQHLLARAYSGYGQIK
ncbi:hypothetical protein B0O99DRAFT_520040 [Bisporella sp. PMI_857]|nr:hypothetical protein B0O99DRAFT_520040 [Bisporella sp. PMI_857]